MSEVGFGIGYRVYNSYPFPLYIKTKSGLDYRVPARDMDKADMGTYVIVTFHKLNYNSVTKVNPDKALTLFDKQVMEKEIKNIKQFDKISKLENSKNDMTSTEEDLLNLVNSFKN